MFGRATITLGIGPHSSCFMVDCGGAANVRQVKFWEGLMSRGANVVNSLCCSRHGQISRFRRTKTYSDRESRRQYADVLDMCGSGTSDSVEMQV